jgi:hypothetical protein
MGIGYQQKDLEIVDYQLYPLKSKTTDRVFILRGPQLETLEKNQYFACVGAAYTFGRFCQNPYPTILQQRLGLSVLNLGFAGAGPYFFLKNKPLINYVNEAKFAIILVMSGRSESNSLFDSGGLEMYTRRADGQKIAAQLAYEDLLANYSLNEVKKIVEETRQNWLDNHQKLLSAITVPKILLWFSFRQPEYQEKYKTVHSLFSHFPQLVNREMLEEIKAHSDDYVECISTSGSPQLLLNRFTGKPSSVTGRTDLGGKVMSHNVYYASPEMHIEAADVLESVCRKYL